MALLKGYNSSLSFQQFEQFQPQLYQIKTWKTNPEPISNVTCQ